MTTTSAAPTPTPGPAAARRRPRPSFGHVLAVAAMVGFAAVVILPVLYTVVTAFETAPQTGYGPDTSQPLGALKAAWDYGLMPGSLLNSVITSSGAVIALWVIGGLAAYGFTLLHFRLREVLFVLVVGTVLIPVQVIMYPLFIEFRNFGLTNSHHGLILGFVVFGLPLTTFQFAAYFKTLPRETIDAARVDGASPMQTFFRVVLPMSKPILAVTGIINFVWTYNDVLTPFLLVTESEKKPLVAQLAVITQSQFFASSVPVLAAAAVLGFAPTIVVYLIAQRQIVRGITAGAVK